MGEWVLRARGLSLGYGGRVVLRDVDLEVREGELWFWIGANGSGKTTLVRAVLGMLAPLSGVLERHGDLERRERLGFVPQAAPLRLGLPTTVREFVSLGFVGSRTPHALRREALAWALAAAGLEHAGELDYASLSGGQRRRALLARALVRRPRLLVLDEPTEGLDADSEAGLVHALVELRRREVVTALVVTHDLELAARTATHLLRFEDGTARGSAAPGSAARPDAQVQAP